MPKITKTTVGSLKPAGKGRRGRDSEVPGFGARCKPGDRKTG